MRDAGFRGEGSLSRIQGWLVRLTVAFESTRERKRRRKRERVCVCV
jgi:hypothetical protein